MNNFAATNSIIPDRTKKRIFQKKLNPLAIGVSKHHLLTEVAKSEQTNEPERTWRNLTQKALFDKVDDWKIWKILHGKLSASRLHSFPYLLIQWIRQRFKVNVWVNPPAASNFMAPKIASSTPAIDTGFGNIKFGSKLFWGSVGFHWLQRKTLNYEK